MDGAIGVLVRYGYLVVFGSVLAEQIGVPIPAIPVLLAAGGMAGNGRLSLGLILAFAGVASLAADMAWYWIGRVGGARVLGWLCRISLEPDSCVAFVVVGWLFAYQLEVAAEYAVHFGSWTLVLLAAAIGGYVAWKFIARQRFLRKIRIARITPEELKIMLDGGEDMLVVDVRDRIDFEAEPSIIPGALHLTVEELDARHHEIPREREIVLYCT